MPTAGTTQSPRSGDAHKVDPQPVVESNPPSCSHGPCHTSSRQPQKRKRTRTARDRVLTYLMTHRQFSILPYEDFIRTQLDQVSSTAAVDILMRLDAAVQGSTPGLEINPNCFVVEAVKRLLLGKPSEQVLPPPPQRWRGTTSIRSRAGPQGRPTPPPAASHTPRPMSLVTQALAIGEAPHLPQRQVFQSTNTGGNTYYRGHSRNHKAVSKHTLKTKTWRKDPPKMITSFRRHGRWT